MSNESFSFPHSHSGDALKPAGSCPACDHYRVRIGIDPGELVEASNTRKTSTFRCTVFWYELPEHFSTTQPTVQQAIIEAENATEAVRIASLDVLSRQEPDENGRKTLPAHAVEVRAVKRRNNHLYRWIPAVSIGSRTVDAMLCWMDASPFVDHIPDSRTETAKR